MTINLGMIQALSQLQAIESMGSSSSDSESSNSFSSLLSSLMNASSNPLTGLQGFEGLSDVSGSEDLFSSLAPLLSGGDLSSLNELSSIDNTASLTGLSSSLASSSSSMPNSILSRLLNQITDPAELSSLLSMSDSGDGLPNLGESSFDTQSRLGEGNVNPTLSNGLNEGLTGTSSLDKIIDAAGATYNIDPNLIRSVIQQESGYQNNEISGSGAIGFMQLMPATATALGVTDPMNPVQNIMGGTKYLGELLSRYNGNKTLALAAYNAGPGAVDHYKGIPPYNETQNYVKSILQNYYKTV